MKLSKSILTLSAIMFSLTCFAENTVVNMANEYGIKSCKKQIKAVGDYNIKDRKHATHAFWNSKEPDKRVYSTFTVMSYSDGDSHLSITVSPNPSGKCDATYIETFVIKGSCLLAREKTFKSWKFSGDLNDGTIALTNDTGAVNIYLTPQLNNTVCMLSKKEVVFQ